MLVLAALLAVSAASPSSPPLGARLESRVSVRIVRGGAVREGRVERTDGDERPTGGKLVVADPDGRRFLVSLTEFP
jgi:hypothetical protein